MVQIDPEIQGIFAMGFFRGWTMRTKVLAASSVAVVIIGGALLMARGSKDGAVNPPQLPFRMGKVQQQDLQVSVREVGAVDPYTKVDVKSAVSGRIVGLKVQEGDTVRSGEVLAEVEPDVDQAQS